LHFDQPLNGRSMEVREVAAPSVGRQLHRYEPHGHGPDRERMFQVVLGQLTRQGYGLLIVGIVALQQRRYLTAALAGEHDELHDCSKDAADFVGPTPYCAQLVIGQDAFALFFLACL
jgi:hypothetical protein